MKPLACSAGDYAAWAGACSDPADATVLNPPPPPNVAERLGGAGVVFILWVTGRYDLLVEVVSDAEGVLCGFLEQHSFNQTDISNVEVMKGLMTYKKPFLLKRDEP